MSFQPQGPMFGQQPVPSPSPPPVKGKRRKGLIWLGLLLMVGGLIGGGLLVMQSESNYEEAVKTLARAPVGCTTTLVFDKADTFTIYIETKGKVGDLTGDCEANGAAYQHAGDKLPKVSMTLVDSSDAEIDLQRGSTASYDVAGSVGTGSRTVTITEPGTYRLNVESEDSDFAVAIGKDPKADSELLKTVGGAVALGGLVLGLTSFLLGLRRRRPVLPATTIRNPAAPLPGWPPGPYATAPPTAPLQPGLRIDGPVGPQPIRLPEQPPLRLPDQPATGFAPPTLAPPSLGAQPPLPTAPSTAAAPSMPPAPPAASPTVPPPAPDDGDDEGWAKPDD